ncbi:hypothetical protein H7C18_04380 [Cohnella sp. CBP 2801]|uniref:Photosynthesis system II assembly factor Ycf48/Hcf136-like domain-containing protein n=2 Tax=Cohnella zeiphila TaxID=2761120 RepID=A0A7X0SHN8_9BACL|nr:hypothetical protein [Cohnella zeiphila]
MRGEHGKRTMASLKPAAVLAAAILALSACAGKNAPELPPSAESGSAPGIAAAETGGSAASGATAEATPGASPAALAGSPSASAAPSRVSKPAEAMFTGGPASFQLADGGRTGWLWGDRGGKLELLRTTDGGSSWQAVLRKSGQAPETGGEFGLPQVLFPNSRTVMIGWSDGKETRLLRTDDLGETWAESSVAYPVRAVDMQFVGEKDGWLLATGLDAAMGHTQKKVFRTVDGGKSWKLASSDTGYIPDPDATGQALPQYGAALGLSFADAKLGWAALENPLDAKLQLYRTSDSGSTWQEDALPPPDGIDAAGIYSVPEKPRFADAQGRQGYFAAAYVSDGQVRYGKFETADGGKTWSSFEMLGDRGTDRDKASLAFANEEDGWSLLDGTLRKTADGGRSWTEVPGDGVLRSALAKMPIPERMQFADAKSGWLLCRSEKDGGWALLGTRDGGASWKELASG